MKQTAKPSAAAAWRHFAPYARPHRALAAGFLAAALIGAAANLAQAQFLEGVIDTALRPKPDGLALYAALYLAVLAVDLASAYFQRSFYGAFSAHFMHDFRYSAVARLEAIPTAAMEKRHSGDLLARLTNDLAAVQDFFGSTLLDAFKQLVMLVAAAAYLAVMNWRLLLVSVFIVPLALAAVNFLQRPMRGYFKQASEAVGRSTAVVQDALGGMATVKAFGLERALARKYGVEIDAGLAFDIKAAGLMRWRPPFNILMRAMPTVFCIGYGSLLIIRGELTAGGLIAFNYLLGFVQWPLAFLPDLLNRIRRALAAADRLTEVLDIPAERTDGAGFPPADAAAGADAEALRFEAVSFGYDDRTEVLRAVDFELKRGEQVAVVGASGCGKSTILKLLGGDYETHRGRILVWGRDTRDWSLPALRDQFAVVTQDVFLFPASVYDNIAYGRSGAERDDVVQAARSANADEFIRALPEGYDTLVGERGVKLSGGQKQRIALARAFLRDAPILLLDEPTSALDTRSEALVQEAIDRNLDGRTAVIVAHRLSTIKKADRILVLADGAVAERGTHDELIARGGLYAALYRQQFAAANAEASATAEAAAGGDR
jgi:subfamily B ATP-binding cassette protein MsbA/ATP-binding cassette subfamily B protein AbcA/BmrA